MLGHRCSVVDARSSMLGRRCSVVDARSSMLGRRCSVVDARSSMLGRRCGRLRSRKNSAALRFYTHIHRPYSADVHKPLESHGRRRSVVAAGDYVRAKTPLRSVFTLTSIAPTPLTSSIHWSRMVVVTRSSLRAITFTQKLRCAPFFRSHPSSLLSPLPRRLQCRCCEISTTARRQRISTSSEVGAMDVSRSEAQRADTNVIARSDDRATISDSDDNG
jgi:hypothetical protein